MNNLESNDSTKVAALEVLKKFRIIFKSSNRHFHAIEKVAGIGGASVWALAEIAELEGLTVSKLAHAMSIHQSTASNLIEKLETQGYVIRIRGTEDRRVVYLKLTDPGRHILSLAPLPHRGILPDALMRMPSQTLAEINQRLAILIAGMESKFVDGAFEPLGKI
jgi:MarR family transcriptional regulator, organic hydroperoxide resistance regulator